MRKNAFGTTPAKFLCFGIITNIFTNWVKPLFASFTLGHPFILVSFQSQVFYSYKKEEYPRFLRNAALECGFRFSKEKESLFG
jgi:hypothetical protein